MSVKCFDLQDPNLRDWCTELGKAFTMAGYNLAIIGAGCLIL